MISNAAEVDGLAVEVAAPDDGRGLRIAILVGVVGLIWAATFGPDAWRSAKKMLHNSLHPARRDSSKLKDDGDNGGGISKLRTS
jgi:hypothetical protein